MEIIFESESPQTACFTCDHVLNMDLPILLVAHDLDGDWQFMCGIQAHSMANAKIITYVEALALDPSLLELETLPIGHNAMRASKEDGWQIIPIKS
jgi:hypothetical protein